MTMKKIKKQLDKLQKDYNKTVEVADNNTKTYDKFIQDLDKDLNNLINEFENSDSKTAGSIQSINTILQDVAKRITALESKQCGCEIQLISSHPTGEYLIKTIGGYEPLNIFISKPEPTNANEPVIKPTPNYFKQAKKLLIDYANKTLIKKGNEYTPTGDRFGNFRPILNQKKTALEKLLGYSEKHVQYMYMQKDAPTCNDINELLEHFGDAFNYNILGIAMGNTDIKNSVVGYADRQVQEKEINDIVKALESANSTSIRHKGYEGLMQCVSYWNLGFIMIELAKHLERINK